MLGTHRRSPYGIQPDLSEAQSSLVANPCTINSSKYTYKSKSSRQPPEPTTLFVI